MKDADGEFYRLVTLWKSTREEEMLYAENSYSIFDSAVYRNLDAKWLFP